MSDQDARARLDAIKARADAATDGPWENDETDPGVWSPKVIVFGNYTARDDFDSPMWEDGTAEDREFIAHARTDLPDMAAALIAVLEIADEWASLAGDGSAVRVLNTAATDLRRAITSHLTQSERR